MVKVISYISSLLGCCILFQSTLLPYIHRGMHTPKNTFACEFCLTLNIINKYPNFTLQHLKRKCGVLTCYMSYEEKKIQLKIRNLILIKLQTLHGKMILLRSF